jgi:DNA-binding CsgD family transcriptional regulator
MKLKGVLPNSDSPGLLLLDRFLRPLYANEEAVSILCYPETPRRNKRLGGFLVHRIDSLLSKQGGSLCSNFSNEFVSGKRRYQGRVFKLKPRLRNSLGPTLAVLLERKHRASLDLLQIGQEFRLTRRETEALGLLMQGYTTGQIASRMEISPNTAKSFLRSVMFKTGALHRSGVLAKILQISKRVTP